MPIRPELKARYPKNWQDIRSRILERAGRLHAHWPHCEGCGVPNHTWIERRLDGEWDVSLPTYDNAVYIVLTIAHLDHIPEHNDPTNLRAWCQKCHNGYDMPKRIANRKARRRARLAIHDLFEGA